MKLTFLAQDLKKGLSLAKIVKPTSGDFTIQFNSSGMTIYSCDKRRFSLVTVKLSDQLNVDWTSDEYQVPLIKMALFDSELTSVSMDVKEKSLHISATDGVQTYKANIPKRIESIRKNRIPTIKLDQNQAVEIDKKTFAHALHMVGCSAMIKETKTDEEMRMNQVHFRMDQKCVTSNTRYHASIVDMDPCPDISIVSADIPTIKSFCEKVGGSVRLFNDKHRLYVIDSQTNSMLVLNKVASVKPDFVNPIDSKFKTKIVINRDRFLSGLDWAITALNGTQRLTCDIVENEMRVSNNGEIFTIPLNENFDGKLQIDIPAKFLRLMVEHIDSDDVIMKINHEESQYLVSISNQSNNVRHYTQVMRAR